jgi:tetratricopeptide (TPR) repeat protein
MSEEHASRGTLAQTPIAQVMAYIYRRGLSGSLVIATGNGAEYRIVFIDGMPAYVEGKGLGHPVGDIFVDAGLMTFDEMNLHLGEARKQNLILGQYLLQNGIVEKRQLETAVRIQIRKRIKDIFGVAEGNFSFFPDENLTGFKDENMVRTSLPAILPECLRLTWSDERLAEKLESLRGHTFAVSDADGCRKQFGWNKQELASLDVMGAKRWTLDQVEASAADVVTSLRVVLYALLLTGNLTFEDADEETQRLETQRRRKIGALAALMAEKLKQVNGGSYFDVLEVAPEAGLDAVKDSYMRLLKAFHPDRVAPLKEPRLKEGFEIISRSLKEAFDALSNADTRKKYVEKMGGGKQEAAAETEEEKIVRETLTDELAYQKSLVLLNKKQFDDVVKLLEPVVQKEVQNGEYLAAYAWAKLQILGRGEFSGEWIAMLRKAADLTPNSERAHFFLALALQREGALEEYEKHIRLTAEINPHNMEAKRLVHILDTRRRKRTTSFGSKKIEVGFDKLKGFLTKKAK